MKYSSLNKKIEHIFRKPINPYYALFYCILSFIFIISLILFSRSRDLKEWILYHFYYTPLYYVLKEYLYASLIIDGIGLLILSIISLLIGWFCIKLFLSKKEKPKNRAVGLVFALLIPVAIYLFSRSFISDVKFAKEKKHLVVYSYLSKIEKIKRESRKGSKSYDYRFYTNILKEKSRNTYLHLNLDMYQYKDLEMKNEELKSKNINTDSIPVTIYYLPNKRSVLKYEVLDSK